MATTLADINNLINDRRRDAGSGSVDMSTVGFRAINSVLRLFQQIHDWVFTIERALITFNKGITYYIAPSDLKAPIDLRPYRVSRAREFDLVTQNNFDSEPLKIHRFAVVHKGQNQYLRIETSGNKIQLNNATHATGDGVWTGGGAISNVATDSYEFFDLSSSVSFDYNGTSGTLTNSAQKKVDISGYVNRGNVYLNLYMPTVANFSSITIRVGSDASNYWTATETLDYLDETPTANAWNKFGFNIFGIKVGNPDPKNIGYIQVIVNYGANTTAVGFRIENIFLSENIPLELEYYSTNMVKASATGTKTMVFTNPANVDDIPLWSGRWDFVTDGFVNAVLEEIFWITGEREDFATIRQKQLDIIDNLKTRLPSKRRHPETMIKLET